MSRFNTKTPAAPVKNLAGGKAHSTSAEFELMSILLTSFVKDDFYRKQDATLERLKGLIKDNNPEFVRNALVYARRLFGMRTITHVGAAELTLIHGAQPSEFYNAVVGRLDDMLEMLAYLEGKGKLPHALTRGFARAFDRFDAYQIAKYRGDGKWKLVDVVNLVHPKPVKGKNEEGLKALMAGTLSNTATWEAQLSAAGAKEGDKATNKKEAWKGLIETRKIGYFALLKNLRNIIKDAPEALDAALLMLVDARLIKKSLVLPFRYTTAYEEINKSGADSTAVRKTLEALSYATETALDNVPVFDGETLVALDVSGSMSGKPSEIASLLAAVICKRNKCDLLQFESDAKYVTYNPLDSLMTLSQRFRFNGGGTNFNSIFDTARKAYDRIIILSDMQGWMQAGYAWGNGGAPTMAHKRYNDRFKANPHIYSMDLKGYGTLMFPEERVYAMAGFSEKIFDVMKFLESDRQALIKAVKNLHYVKGNIAAEAAISVAGIIDELND